MNRHALEVLQYPQTLDLVAGHASSPLGADRVRALEPSDARAWIETELDRVDELMRTIRRGPGWSMPRIPDCRPALRRLAAQGSVLDAPELRDLADLCDSAGTARTLLRANAERMPTIAAIDARLHPLEPVVRQIRHAVDEDGTVRDNASKDLARIRREMRGARNRIVDKLEQYVASLPARFRVADASVTLREGRYVIPVRREGRGEVGGLVHDESATGQTLFVEPPVAIELMNRLRELEIAESREVQRILRELSESIRPRHDELRESLDALVDLDTVHARANYALRNEGERPVLASAGGEYEVVHGRHPQLLAGSGDTVPFDLRLDPGERTLLISGPNTGGKTVLLKAVGLISALSQSGIIPPVGAGTKLPVFRDLFADIGDEQSIEASLSTFSAHLRNLREIIEQARGDALVLIDEMGSGTDPIEGAALAKSIIVELTRRGAMTLASTHLGELKDLATVEDGVVNASLDFDAKELRPTYRLRKGVPGRSYGLAIAKRLGFPSEVLERAESFVPESERALSTLLEEVEVKERELTAALDEAERAKATARTLERELQERSAELEAKERTAERRARQQARDLLLASRAEVEAAIDEVRSAAAASTTERDAAFHSARSRLEQKASRQAKRVPAKPAKAEPGTMPTFAEGERVRLETMGATGTIVELRDDRATVDVRGVRMQVAVDSLSRVAESEVEKSPARSTAARGSGWSGPDFDASSEVDLRGMRADEAIAKLATAIDAAIQAALPALRIIHGKGTGALREVVAEALRSDRRVASFRAGGIGEGGTGVTVAEMR
jgi:DNA mismatch repair protein MutS2